MSPPYLVVATGAAIPGTPKIPAQIGKSMTLTTRTGSAGRWLVMLSVCLAAMTMPLSFTGPAVALSRIAADLGGSPIELNWVTNAFMLTFGAGLMAAGALADNHGRKRIFLAGLATYVLAALGATLAPDIVWFDIFRALQGIGGAAAFAGGASALAQEFDGQSRLRAFSFLGTSFGIGLAFGPVASGLLIDAFGWRAIFLLVAVLGVAAAALGLRTITESRDPDATGLDWAGAGGSSCHRYAGPIEVGRCCFPGRSSACGSSINWSQTVRPTICRWQCA